MLTRVLDLTGSAFIKHASHPLHTLFTLFTGSTLVASVDIRVHRGHRAVHHSIVHGARHEVSPLESFTVERHIVPPFTYIVLHGNTLYDSLYTLFNMLYRSYLGRGGGTD